MRKRLSGPNVEAYEINMTPMIDCVFLLLTFFLFATKFPMPENKLESSLPSNQSPPKGRAPTIVVIEVSDDGRLLVSGKTYTPDELTVLLAQLAAIDKDQPVIIKGAAEARHQWIVSALNACAKANITRISFTGL